MTQLKEKRKEIGSLKNTHTMIHSLYQATFSAPHKYQ